MNINEKYKKLLQEFDKIDKELLIQGKIVQDTEKGIFGAASLAICFELFKKIELNKYKSFLDLGCGDGRIVLLASLFTKATGIEFDKGLVEKGLKIKGVKNWYFGLNSALKLNNMTHEEFTIDHIINDRLFRGKVIEIVGYKFRFHKVSTDLLKFGIIKEGKIRYSNPEKTILDFLYIKRYNGVPEERIIIDVADYGGNISKVKIRKYVKYYPKTVEKTLERLL